MKKLLRSLIALTCVFLFATQAAAVEAGWYDAVRQALGFDPYRDGRAG